MNYKKWNQRALKGTNPNVFLAKLMEEVGEVGNAMLEKTEDELIEELAHVEFIASCFRKSIRINQVRRGRNG